MKVLLATSFLSAGAIVADSHPAPPSPAHNIYFDILPANTSEYLDIIRRLPVSKYRLSYDPDRVRIGIVGPVAAAVVPDAVDIVPSQIIPPRKPGGKNTVLRNVPIINEMSIFNRGVGAVQELAKMMDEADLLLDAQINRVIDLIGQVEQLEEDMALSTDGEAEMRVRAAATEAKIAKHDLELELQRAKNEEEYDRVNQQAEEEHIRRSENMTLQRLVREDDAARARAEQEMVLKLETSQQLEQAKYESDEVKSAIEHQRALLVQHAFESTKVKTAEAIAVAKANAERENEGLYLRRMKAEYEQKRQRNVAAIEAITHHIAHSISWAVQHPQQVLVVVAYISLLFVAIYVARESSRICFSIIEASVGRPQLVRETTRMPFPISFLRSAMRLCADALDCSTSCRDGPIITDQFQDVILSRYLEDRVVELAVSARNARRHGTPHRHVLLYGQPGTGKTMVARKLAHCIGMDYALMSGGDVGPLGVDAVTQIHALFRWAKFGSKSGVLLFIDEAEAFLASRSKNKMSEDAHNALNALLYNTGTERTDFLLVLATNRPDSLDAAILDRCDESLIFPLPDAECRRRLILQYFAAHVDNGVPPIVMGKGVMGVKQLTRTVIKTDGLSSREISKLMIAVKSKVYATEEGTHLSVAMVDEVVRTHVEEHHDKLSMLKRQHH